MKRLNKIRNGKEWKEFKCKFCKDEFNFYHNCKVTGKFISIDENPEYDLD